MAVFSFSPVSPSPSKRLTCAICGALMRLIRIAPIRFSAPLRCESTFQCDCGSEIGVEESDL
jgi:hypothetical protein